MRRDAEPERGGGERAHERLTPLHVRLRVDADLPDPVHPGGPDMRAQRDLAAYTVRVQPGQLATARLDARRYLACRRGGRDARRVDTFERERHLPLRRFSQRRLGVDLDASSAAIETRRKGRGIAAHARIRASSQLSRERRRLPGGEHRDVPRQKPQLANLKLTRAGGQIVPTLGR